MQKIKKTTFIEFVLYTLMSMRIDFYDKASSYMEKSWECYEASAHVKSWGYTIPARLAYLCETILRAIQLPFAIIAVTFGTLHAFLTWNRKSEIFQTTYSSISKVANHLFLSAFGWAISPALTHKYRNANITPFIIAARIAIISAGLLYALLRK